MSRPTVTSRCVTDPWCNNSPLSANFITALRIVVGSSLSRCKQVSETSRRENEIVAGKLGEIILGLNEISNRVEARYLDPTFPTRAKSGYEGMRIVYTRVTRPRNQLALALFLPVPRTALFYPHFSPFLSFPLSL